MREISLLVEDLLASQEGICSINLVVWLVGWLVGWLVSHYNESYLRNFYKLYFTISLSLFHAIHFISEKL